MLPFEYILLVLSVLILISITLTKFSENLGLPALILFLVVGMLAGSDGPGKIHFDNIHIAQYVGIVALIFILFSGGLETKWRDVKPVMWTAFSLSTLGVLLTTATLGAFVYFFFQLPILESLLIGAIISSTDAAAVFSVLRARGTKLKGKIKPLLELESGSNDPAAIILTIILIQLIQTQDVSASGIIFFLVLQLLLGAAIGFAAGKLLSLAFNKFSFSYPSLYPVFAIASAIFVYALAASLGASGILAVYIAAVILGNSEFIQKRSLIRFFDGLALLGQIVMFLTLGLLVYPSQLYNVIGAGLILSAVLIFLARPIGVFISMLFSKFKLNEKMFISWVGLRGAVPIILATFPLTAGLEIGPYIFNLIFFITLTSALVQGWSIPLTAKIFRVRGENIVNTKLPIEMTDAEKTNNDLLDLIIPQNSAVAGRSLAELSLPPESLITVIYRDNDYVVPNGGSILEEGDTILVLVNKDNIAVIKKIFTQLKNPKSAKPT
ncbi:MAG: potassium/proton antiporter [Ignavibacteria bacterium]|nr:potassium/proton antiporter [Ignavibacteria bacterium]